MQRILFLFTSVAILISSSTGYAQNWNNTNVQLPAGFTHSSYHSTLMNVDIGYSIYLPPNYNNSTDRYPVVYSLHGLGGNETQNCQAYSDVMQSGITSNEFSPVIVVFINGRSNTFYSDSKDGVVKCESTIIQELIPHIDATYRTKADRTQRAIEGFSMGGFGALMHGFKHPDLFCSIATYDAALVNWDTLSQQTFDRYVPISIFGNDRNYFNENSYPFTFAKKNAATIKSLGIKVRITTGDNDLQMGPLYYYNCAMRDTLNKLGINLTFKVTPGGGHGASFHGGNIKEYMIFHSTNFKAAITQTLQPAIISKTENNSIFAPVTFSSVNYSNVAFSNQLKHNSVKAITVFNLSGRSLGNVSVQGNNGIDGSGLVRQFGSGVYTLKAIK
jgi:enterochelin esterase-like enzyme